MTIMDELKAREEGWKESLKIRELAYQSAKQFLKGKEKELRDAKRVVYLTYKSRCEAKINLRRATTKRQGYISKVRQWTKHNMDKVI